MAIAYATARIAPWGTILGAFNIKYIPRTSVKSQVLTDLVVEIAEPPSDEMTEAQHMDGKLVGLTTQDPLSRRVYIDGTTNQR